jgi:hypothetical protein
MRSPASNAGGKFELRKTFVKRTNFLIKRYKIQALYPHGIYTTKSPQGKVRTGD